MRQQLYGGGHGERSFHWGSRGDSGGEGIWGVWRAFGDEGKLNHAG